jgi:DNA-directed RNA polymerase specialized sigma24 family protein
LTQETFLKAFRRMQTFRIRVFHVAASRNCERRAHAHAQKESRANTPRGNHRKEGGNSRPSTGVERSRPLPERSIKRITLHRAIDELPRGAKVEFVLYDIDGYEHPRDCRYGRRSTGASKSQLHKSRLRLREPLQKDQKNGPPGKCILPMRHLRDCAARQSSPPSAGPGQQHCSIQTQKSKETICGFFYACLCWS